MITTYPITTTTFSPVLINGLPTPLTLFNSSTSLTININDTSGGNGYPMAPGSTVSWDAGKPLFASCSNKADLVVLDNAGNIDNPQILAQLIVDSGLGQAVANALVASSLAANIGGAVPVPPSAASIGAAVGSAVPVPPSAAAIGAAVPSAAAIGAAVPVPPSAAAIGAAVPVPPSAASIGAAVGSAVPVPPSAAAIGAAVPVPPSAASIGAAVGGAVPVPPSAASIGAAVGGAVPVPPSAASIGAAVGGAVPVPPSAASIGAAVGGAVPVPPSAAAIGLATQQQLTTAGIPSIDAPLVLLNAGSFNTGSAGNEWISNRYSVGQYGSMRFNMSESVGVYTSPVPRRVDVLWFNSGAAVPITDYPDFIDTFYIMDNNGAAGDARVLFNAPVRAPYMFFRVYNDIAVDHKNTTVTCTLAASYRWMEAANYVNHSGYFAPAGGIGQGDDLISYLFIANKPGSPAISVYPHSTSGLCTVAIMASSVTGVGSIYISDILTTQIYGIMSFVASSSLQKYTDQIHLPNRPIKFASDAALAGTNIRIGLTFDRT